MKNPLLTDLEHVSRNTLLAGVGFVLLATFSLWRGWPSFRALCFGATPVPHEAISGYLAGAPPRYYIEVEGDRVIDTGFEKVERGFLPGEGAHFRFISLAMGDHLLLVKTPAEKPARRFTGLLVPLPAEAKGEVVSVLERAYPDIRGRFVDLMLDAAPAPPRAIARFLAALAVLSLGVFLMQRGARAMESPWDHPSVALLARTRALKFTFEEVEQEVKKDPHKLVLEGVTLTESWIYQKGFFTFKLIPLGDLAWIYPEPRRPWQFWPWRSLVFYDCAGNRCSMLVSERNVDRLFTATVVRAPWAVTGYNRNIEVLWLADRKAFVAEVNDRRKTA